jgi:integrase
MPKNHRIPSYRFHKATGQAVVVLNGRSIYLGPWNTAQSRAKYERVLAEWLAGGRVLPDEDHAPTSTDPKKVDLRVCELILAFVNHGKSHYCHPNGTPTGELENFRHALRPLRQLYGESLACEFGPLRLRAVRQEMLNTGLCRKSINARIHRIRRVFRWAVSMELVPATVLQGLSSVASLQRGRCDAPESPGVRPVEWKSVEATLPHLPEPVAAMIAIMRYSNCRAEDVVMLRACDISQTQDIWEYRPLLHKNQWREESSISHDRVVLFGPRCQEILRPYLTDRSAQSFLFDPGESRAAYQAQRAAGRKTKRTPSELNRPRAKHPKRGPKDHYSVNTFQQTVRKTCRKLGIPVWTVLQIRHSRATEVRAGYGVEGAAASLGNSVEAAQIYAENNREIALRIAREIG